MEISDLAGLSKPLDRLIKVIARGIGAVSAPLLTRANAEADAAKIRRLAAALEDASDQHGVRIEISGQEISMSRAPSETGFMPGPSSLPERAGRRVEYQERMRQENIEKITSVAALELAAELDVPEESPDQDWVNRFFRAAEDISSEQMQDLWGRLLAGEIKNPGSYSLRTLEFVRNLTQENARLLEQLARQAIWYAGAAFVPVHDPAWLKENRLIYEGHQFDAAELGAMYPTKLAYQLFQQRADEGLVSGPWFLWLERMAAPSELAMPIWKFTKVGGELVKLIGNDGDREQLRQLGLWYISRGASAKIGEIVSANGQNYKVRGLSPISAPVQG